MNIGMLWFDNDPKAGLGVKLERAASYYRQKYGQPPTLCFVHPSMLPPAAVVEPEKPALVEAGIEVRSNRSVLPNHFWLGVRSAPALSQP